MSPKAETFFKRLFSTVILLAVLGGAVAWDSEYGYAALICIFCNMTTIEWYRMLRERREECCRWLALFAGLVYPWLLAAVYFELCDESRVISGEFCPQTYPQMAEMCAVPVAALVVYALVAFFVMLRRMDYKQLPAQQALSGMGLTLLAFVYPVWMFAFAIPLMSGEPELLLFLILITKMSDIWAYVSGVLLGRRFISRPFSPVVSPKKSWEGIIGSYILTLVCAVLLGKYVVGISTIEWSDYAGYLLTTTFIFVLAVAGDLAGSLIKRGLGVKDSGSLLPGIGGIFDLIDSPAFTVAAVAAVAAMQTVGM